TLRLAPVVRPRLPSLFEPTAAGPAVNTSLLSETIHEDGNSIRPAAEDSPARVRPLGPGRDPAQFETGSRTTTPDTVEVDTGKRLEASPRDHEPALSSSRIMAPAASQ